MFAKFPTLGQWFQHDVLMVALYRGAGIAFLIQVSGAGLGYVANILYARWLGPSDYGVLTFVTSLALLLAQVAGLGLPTGLLRFIPEYSVKEDWPRLKGVLQYSRRLVMVVSLALAVLVIIPAMGFLQTSGSVYASPLLAGALTVPLWTGVLMETARARAGQTMAVAYGPPRVLRPLLLIIGGFVLVSIGLEMSATISVSVGAGAMLIVLAIQRYLVQRYTPLSVENVSPQYEKRIWLGTSLPLLLTTGFGMVLNQINLLIIGLLLEADQVGVYGAASLITEIIVFPVWAVEAFAVPMFASLHARADREGLQKLVSSTANLSFWPSLAIACALVILSRFALGLFGPEFAQARVETIILACGTLFTIGMGRVHQLLNVTGHQRQSAFIIGCSTLIGISLNLVATHLWGITGAAIARVVTLAIWTIWLYIVVVRRLGVHASIGHAICVALRRQRTPISLG